MWMWSTISYVVRWAALLHEIGGCPRVVCCDSKCNFVNAKLSTAIQTQNIANKTRIFKYKNRYNQRLLNYVLK